MMGKGGHGSCKQQSRDTIVQQLQKLQVLDPQVQQMQPPAVLHSKEHPSSLQSRPLLEPSKASMDQKQMQQQQQQQQQPKASPNQLHSNEQQQAADLQNSQSLDSQILATSETSQLRTEACNDGLIQGGDAFWRSSSCQVHSSSKVFKI
jgi:hypothetical protein